MEPTCIYKIRRDFGPQEECGAPATHRAAKRLTVTLCEMHAQVVGRTYLVLPIKDGYTSFEPSKHRRF
jgi:hypothetical protein